MAINNHITIGQQFGRLTVISEISRSTVNGYHRRKLTARCACGTVKEYDVSKVQSGHSKSCGCLRNKPATNRVEFEFGQRFGRLVYIGEAETTAKWRRKIVMRCDCGSLKTATSADVLAGDTQSCGCLGLETSIETLLRYAPPTHGMTGTKTFKSWDGAIQRCHNPRSDQYSNYGGRGIVVCDEWRESFEAFYADMGERPKGMTLDRKDVDLGYNKLNCRWATNEEQQNNRRDNRYVTRDGRTQTITQWAREFGIRDTLVFKRRAAGWPEERWFEPSQSQKK